MELQLVRTTLRERIDHLTELILTSASTSIEDGAHKEKDDTMVKITTKIMVNLFYY
jgi:hypothetical protein